MGNRSSLVAVAVGLIAALCCGGTRAENWFALQSVQGEDIAVEADASSIRTAGGKRLMRVRVTHPLPRTHRTGAHYRSVVAQVEVDCDTQQAAYREAEYFAQPRGAGSPVARDDPQLDPTTPPSVLIPLQSLQMLTRAACGRLPPTR